MKNHRLYLLTWIIVPLLGMWLSINYLLGLNHRPIWDGTADSGQISAKAQVVQAAQPTKLNWNGNGLITLWFDDTWESQYLVALPIMRDKGLVGALAVPTNLVGLDAYMNWVQVKRLSLEGWEIDSHTRNHNCDPKSLTDAQVESELGGSKQDLTDKGFQVENFVTPCGADTPSILASAKKHYLSLRSSEDGLNDLPIKDPYHIKAEAVRSTTTVNDVNNWISQAKSTHSWLIIMFHQIDAGQTDYATTPAKFEQMVESVKQSNLQVVLPSQALQLVRSTATTQ